ncbi:hypothetical protein CHS0354_035274 [Potamilus streckersoni]|uniref:Aconitate hydratase n=1 Tax=Potamilus streckersoni TaxID=2493646 RepID=A0AAE0S2W4_9BIVA|nr:hypothetical protein CHS0354_035274 [Potamilus streckersoni]
MINGVGVLGWGVGGIEAESAMLGQPIYMKIPQVIGFKLTGKLNEGVTSTDLVLTVTQILRKRGVVEKFVEFFGPGLDKLSLADRATIANMAPEYGATMGFFPVDGETLRYMKDTGRDANLISLVEAYMKEQGCSARLIRQTLSLRMYLNWILSTVEPCLAGPKRPQDKVFLKDMKKTWQDALTAPTASRGFELKPDKLADVAKIDGVDGSLSHGSVVIAAITSCTNTSNPSVMIGAGLVAKKAAARGLKAKPWVKTSLAPGSRVVTEYLNRTDLTRYLDEVGFYTVGYGCTTCIASVLSGNRNFEGRVHPEVKANYLASPLLVVVYALAGTVNIDLMNDPIAHDASGKPVFMKDIWPSHQEIQAEVSKITGELFKTVYSNTDAYSAEWKTIKTQKTKAYEWDSTSTYIQNPPFFKTMKPEVPPLSNIKGARVLLKLGDSITTDHISPAGSFKADTPAGKFLTGNGVSPADFNSYGSRRGNDRIMTRGTFANIRIRNQILKDTEGGFTKYFPSGETIPVYDAAIKYAENNTPLVILAGAEYGSGSSRDWAAKGTYLLGVRAVIAASYERIHRSNLVGMGVLPLQFKTEKRMSRWGLPVKRSSRLKGLIN